MSAIAKPVAARQPTDLSTPDEAAIHRRAIEAVIWGMPAVNSELLFEAMTKNGGQFNQVVYWSKLLNWKNQTLTPNPDTIYLFPFINTKDVGPVVLEIPAAVGGSITGSLDDAWQTAIEDIGPAGFDKGKGGKYLVLPPGYADDVPPGYLPMRAETFASEAFLRSIIAGGGEADIAKAVAYGRQVKVYPLSQAAHLSPTVFVDAFDKEYDSTIPYNLRFFELLDRFVQREPWLTRDKAMIDPLRSIGIEKGKPFRPGSKAREILARAIAEAHEWLEGRYEKVFSPPYFDGGNWALPASPDVIEGMSTAFAKPDSYPVDGRGLTYSFVYFSAKHLGAGQFYLMAIRDKAGQPFDGASTYRLTVPANPPVKQYWSATVYDRATHALIRNASRSSRSSNNPGQQKNADGSVDVYFGPNAPAGHEPNWVPTSPKGRFEVLFRLYGPTQALFDKTWKLPDIERVN